jgi:hypothetical protein
MKSLLHQPNATPFTAPPGCGLGRQEVSVRVVKDDREYTFTLRDKVMPEDTLLPMTKAIAFAIQQNEPYAGKAPSRSTRDYLVKSNVVI